MSQFPDMLKTWRKARRFSQLELALEADVSSRHISFLETGRAKPSPEMIGRLSDALHLPLDTRNQMLTYAGFAARYRHRDWDEDEMVPVRRAVDYTLQAHAPYPAMALDRLWSVVALNEPAELLFKPLGIEAGSNLLDFVTSSLVATLVENWPEVAHHTARRLRTESLAQGSVSELDKAADILAAVGGSATLSELPVVPTVYRFDEMRLSLFSTIAQFGTPTDLALDDLKIELFFPTDEQTRQFLESLSPPKDSSS